jgi:hypothetical protein
MVTLFGLGNMPSAFIRVMHLILGLYWKFTIIYLVDILIFSPNLAEHKLHSKTILLVIREAQLHLNKLKCVSRATEISFASLKVNLNGIHKEDKKIAAM